MKITKRALTFTCLVLTSIQVHAFELDSPDDVIDVGIDLATNSAVMTTTFGAGTVRQGYNSIRNADSNMERALSVLNELNENTPLSRVKEITGGREIPIERRRRISQERLSHFLGTELEGWRANEIEHTRAGRVSARRKGAWIVVGGLVTMGYGIKDGANQIVREAAASGYFEAPEATD